MLEGKDVNLEGILKRSCRFEQQAGEIVFIPRHWSHQVINLAETIGFAIEIQDYE